MKTLKFIGVLFFILCLFVMPVSAFDDSVQRYDVDFEEVWDVTVTGTGTVTQVNYPTAYSTSQSILVKATAKYDPSSSGTALIKNSVNITGGYIGFTVYASNSLHVTVKDESLKFNFYNTTSGSSIGSFGVGDELNSNGAGRYEFVRQGSSASYDLYFDGVDIGTYGLSENTGEFTIGFYVYDYGNWASTGSTYSTYMYLDDFSTSSILGMNAQWSQADTNIDVSYGIQSQSSFPTDEYTIKVVRPSTSATINTTSLGTGTTGNESGFVGWNRNNIFGSNFGLYQATLYRESDVLTNTYFSIFDTTIQGTVDWGEDSYTIDQTPDIFYVIINGDLSTYTYTLKIVDSLQQIKESYTLNSYFGTKGPNLAGYSTGTYYAILSRKHKSTDKVDDFAFDTVEISAAGVSPRSYINFGLDQYTIGDTASYTFNWAEDDTSFWTRERVVIEKDGVILDRINAGLSGTRYLDMDELGRYSISLISYGLLTYGNPIMYAIDSVECIEPLDSFINAPQTAEQKTNFTVNYLYGTTPPTAAMFIKKLDEQLEEYILYDIIYLDGGTAGTSYSQSVSIWGEGFYKLVLYNANVPESDLKTDVIQITKVIIPPQTHINSSRIRSQEDTYSKSDMVLGDYAVDFINYTSYVINLELYNYEYDAVVYSETVSDQSGTVLIPLYLEDMIVFTGINNIRLSSYTNTGAFIDDIVHDNITINLVGPEGYGLSLSTYEVYTDEIFVIKCIVPQASTLEIINRLTLEEMDNFEVNASLYINYKISQIGNYEIRLITSEGYVRGNQYINVVEGTIKDDPVVEDDDVVTPSLNAIDMVIMFLSMPAFWGMIIWVGVVGGAAQSNAVNRSSTGYIAFALGNILAVVGMFAPYTMYILVILWIGAGVFFKLGREAAGSEEY